MTVADLLEWCRRIGACAEAREWLATLSPSADARTAWERCSRADWLLWWAAHRPGVTRQELVLAAWGCVRPVLCLVPEGEGRPLRAVELAEAWCRGEVTWKELWRAAAAARAAASAASAASAAYAAYAAYAAAANAKMDSLKKSADICREILTKEVLLKYKQLKTI